MAQPQDAAYIAFQREHRPFLHVLVQWIQDSNFATVVADGGVEGRVKAADAVKVMLYSCEKLRALLANYDVTEIDNLKSTSMGDVKKHFRDELTFLVQHTTECQPRKDSGSKVNPIQAYGQTSFKAGANMPLFENLQLATPTCPRQPLSGQSTLDATRRKFLSIWGRQDKSLPSVQ